MKTYRGTVSMQRLSVLLYPDEVEALLRAVENTDYSPALELAYEQLRYAHDRALKRVHHPRTLVKP